MHDWVKQQTPFLPHFITLINLSHCSSSIALRYTFHLASVDYIRANMGNVNGSFSLIVSE